MLRQKNHFKTRTPAAKGQFQNTKCCRKRAVPKHKMLLQKWYTSQTQNAAGNGPFHSKSAAAKGPFQNTKCYRRGPLQTVPPLCAGVRATHEVLRYLSEHGWLEGPVGHPEQLSEQRLLQDLPQPAPYQASRR